MRRVLIGLVGLLAASALQAAPYEGEWKSSFKGKWAPEDLFCYLPVHSSFMSLKGNLLTHSESVYYCILDRVRQAGSQFTISMTCEGETIKRHKDRMILKMFGPDRLSVWRKSDGKRPAQKFIRCRTLDQGERIERLIGLWDNAEAACRGSGNEEACEQRRIIHQWLGVYNSLCFGKEGEEEDRKRWHKCTLGSVRLKPWNM